MTPSAALEMMKAYFADRETPEVLAGFASLQPTSLLKESLDVVDFVVYLEEELEREIDVRQLGQALVNMNFGELAEEVSRILGEGNA